MRSLLASALLLVVASAQLAAAPFEPSPNAGVRPLSRQTAALLDDALRRSPLVRSEVDVIDASDVVVYLTEVFKSESGEPNASLRFLSSGGGKRYLVVRLDRWNLSWNDRLVLLAHELQHAVEVARSPGARDLVSFSALFRRIGWEMRAGRFETDGAVEASMRMRIELQSPRPSAPAASYWPAQGPDDNGRNLRRNRRNP